MCNYLQLITCILLQVLENLKFMSLADCKYLIETPDFSRVTNLKILNFDGCTHLRKIHSSIGQTH